MGGKSKIEKDLIMNNEVELIEFRAGNKKEIRQSLANYCQVSIQEIEKDNIQEIYDRYCVHPYAGISNALWKKFNPQKQREIPLTFKVYRYHKTGTNGKKEWFLEGLLGQDRGIRNYIKNLYKFYNIDLFKFEERLIYESAKKNELDDDDGPYAFMSYKYAKDHSGFNTAEVLEDVLCDEMVKLRCLAEERLLPTVLIFWVDLPIEQLDKYLLYYCKMFLGLDCACASVAINKDIPFNNIESIKILPKDKKDILPISNTNELSGTHVFSRTMLKRD